MAEVLGRIVPVCFAVTSSGHRKETKAAANYSFSEELQMHVLLLLDNSIDLGPSVDV